jgi:hypothetical protein
MRSAWPERTERRAARPSTSVTGAAGSLEKSAFGRRSIAMSFARTSSPFASARFGTATSIVSTAVPV